jgi:hypothetical protein
VYGWVEEVSAWAERPEAGTLLADIDAILFSQGVVVVCRDFVVNRGFKKWAIKPAFALK